MSHQEETDLGRKVIPHSLQLYYVRKMARLRLYFFCLEMLDHVVHVVVRETLPKQAKTLHELSCLKVGMCPGSATAEACI